MNKLLIGAIALAGTVMSLPAQAQVYFGFGGGPRYERHYDNGYGYDNGYRRHYGAYARDYRQCRIVRVWAGDGYRRIRRCY